MTSNAPPGNCPDPPQRQRRRHAAHRQADRGASVNIAFATMVLTALTLVATIAVPFVLASRDSPPATTLIVVMVTDVTPQTSALTSCALTVTSEGGTTTMVHPPSTPEGPDHKEIAVSINQGQHVTAEFGRNDVVEAIVLEVRGDEALVQEKGTRRAEWIPLSDIR